MRRSLILIFAAFAVFAAAGKAAASDISVEPVIWQFNKDYPGAQPDDLQLPIRTVYIKTHDGTDWMSTFDPSPYAISGPGALSNDINSYAYKGIGVVAWFVPKGGDVDTQVAMAEQVIDTGVQGLYADVEPFAGFCYGDCAYLAQQFWQRLRAERPYARLGVIYDPRTQWLAPADISGWLVSADVALPSCYWETFAGQQPWSDPGSCVWRAHSDLASLAPGRGLEYDPMLQGDTSPDRFRQGLDAATAVGATRVSVWRRGVVPADVWQEISAYLGQIDRACWVTHSDNCLVKEAFDPRIYIIQGGARFWVPDLNSLAALSASAGPVNLVPQGFLSTLPQVPRDGTLLQEIGSPAINVVYASAHFLVPSPANFDALGLDWGAVRPAPPGALASLATVPREGSWLKELSSPNQYVILRGGAVWLEPLTLQGMANAGRLGQIYILPDGAMQQVPATRALAGDADCDGGVDARDALQVLRRSAGLPNLGLCARIAADVTCDGAINSADALLLLRYNAGLSLRSIDGCRPIGSS